MDKPYSVVIADDNPTFVDGLKILLERRPEIDVLACYYSGDELLNDDKYGYADLILLDIEMPGKNGIVTAKRINFNYPQIKIIAITMYQDQVYLQQLIEAGFRGFVNKTEVGEKLLDVIHSVMDNTFVFPENIELF
jgi:DNA-binding NarL/FixJ family response regulator